jgi:nucleotide-binding universal stress UspA family protein
MPRILILANQTASSPELTNAVREIIKKDAATEFVLLVPATPVEDLLDWQDGDNEGVAKRTAQTAKEHLEGVGANVIRTEVGDPSPVKAIEDELQRHEEKYDGILISTLPLQRSRWVALDQPRRIERRFKLPVIHVVGHSVTMTREELINGLNEDLNLELETLLRGVYHAAAGRGMLGHELRELLKRSCRASSITQCLSPIKSSRSAVRFVFVPRCLQSWLRPATCCRKISLANERS